MLRRRIACPHCESELSLPADAPIGARVECASCDQLFRLPAARFEIHEHQVSGTVSDTVPDSFGDDFEESFRERSTETLTMGAG